MNCTDPDSIHCNDGVYCISRNAFCDGLICCPDGSDEHRIGFGLKCKVEDGNHPDVCLIPDYHKEEDNFICAKKDDKCYANHTGPRIGHCFRCIDGKNVRITRVIEAHHCYPSTVEGNNLRMIYQEIS